MAIRKNLIVVGSETIASEQKKIERSQPLYRALERIIPDIRQRVVLELIGTPLTHAGYLRCYQGTYGPAIPSGQGMFPNCHTPISGLYRVGDSTMPGIGVPTVDCIWYPLRQYFSKTTANSTINQ